LTYAREVIVKQLELMGGCPAFLLKMAKRSLPLVSLRGLHFVRKNAVV